jgi:hypothetical protein
MIDGEDQSARFFYGLQPRWLTWDRLYRVYVSDQMIAGAYIAGDLYDEQAAALKLQQLHLFLRLLVRRLLAQRREREARYDDLDPFAPSLLDHDPRNFQLSRSDVTRTRFRRNRSLWAAYNVGVVELELLDGTTRRLILVGDQEPEAVLELMRRFDPAIEVTGKPNPLPRPQPMSPAGKRLYFLLVAAALFGFGALFGYAGLAGVAPNLPFLPLAAINVLLGGWWLVRAWRAAKQPQEPEEAERINRSV